MGKNPTANKIRHALMGVAIFATFAVLFDMAYGQVTSQSGVVITPTANGTIPTSQGGLFLNSTDGMLYWQPFNASAVTDPTKQVIRDIPQVLYFAGSGPGTNSHVQHGLFWNYITETPLGYQMWWEFWAKCPVVSSSSYSLSDGYGGAHTLLYSICSQELTGSPYAGNITGHNGSITFASSLGINQLNTWHHYAVAISGDHNNLYYIYTVIDGVCTGATILNEQRVSCTNAGCGTLYIGGAGSGSNQEAVYLSQIRAFDTINPYFSSGSGCIPFSPQRHFSGMIYTGDPPAVPDLLVNYMTPASIIPDLSAGYPLNGTIYRHPGFLSGPLPNVISTATNPGGPHPYWVQDPSAPFNQGSQAEGSPPTGLTPASVPVGAKIFDSFNRAYDSNWTWNSSVTLGQTEGGSLGVCTWNDSVLGPGASTSPVGNNIGIFQGKAVWLGYLATGYILARPLLGCPLGTGDMDVRVDRTYGGALINGTTGLIWRYQDANNFFATGTLKTADNATRLDIFKVLAGVQSTITQVTISGAANVWKTLRVVTAGNSTIIYTGTTASGPWTIRYNGTQTDLVNAQITGIATTNNWTEQTLVQWDNFTAY